MSTDQTSRLLPMLRPDVELLPGPDDVDGSPTYTIHDPTRGTFDRATWIQAQILNLLRTPMTVECLLDTLAGQTTIRVRPEEVQQLCADVSRKGLTMDSLVADERRWEAHRRRKGAVGWFDFLVRRLIYVRIPLLRPGPFLTETLGLVRHLAHPIALSIYSIVALVGMLLALQRLDAYLTTFPYFFNLRGVILFAATVVCIKVVHELGHAYTATAMGTHIRSMGVALIMMLPVAYSDVTDSWRLAEKRKRVAIGLAGVISELIIAGIALFAWSIAPQGAVKSICFVLSSVTILSTLLVNLNPAMRYDGYYVLCDLVGMDNLQSRSSAVLRWLIRRHLLGLDVPFPEATSRSRRTLFMVAYACYSWLYRLSLYSGIALAFYYRLTKAVGIILFVAAAWSLIIRPIISELATLVVLGRRSRRNWRMAVVGLAGAMVFIWFAAPIQRRREIPAITVPKDSQVIYTPHEGTIEELNVKLGQRVSRGDILFVIRSKTLDDEAALARLEIRRVELELSRLRSDPRKRPYLPGKSEELAKAKAHYNTILAAAASNKIIAEIDGLVVEWDHSMRNGTPVGSDQALGKIVSEQTPSVIAYLRHDFVSELSSSDRVSYCSRADSGKCDGTVVNIDPVRTEFLVYAGLSSIANGDMAVTNVAGRGLRVLESYYEVEAVLDTPAARYRTGQVGVLSFRSPPRSHLVEFLRHVRGVLIRESSF